jgi:hypothetical protein
VRLLLESTLALDGQFGSHLVGWAWAKMSFWSSEVVGSPQNFGWRLSN